MNISIDKKRRRRNKYIAPSICVIRYNLAEKNKRREYIWTCTRLHNTFVDSGKSIHFLTLIIIILFRSRLEHKNIIQPKKWTFTLRKSLKVWWIRWFIHQKIVFSFFFNFREGDFWATFKEYYFCVQNRLLLSCVL